MVTLLAPTHVIHCQSAQHVHHSGTEQCRNRHSDYPSICDIAEQMPIDSAILHGCSHWFIWLLLLLLSLLVLLLLLLLLLLATRCTHMSHENHRTDLAMSCRNGQANFAGQQNGDSGAYFDSEATTGEDHVVSDCKNVLLIVNTHVDEVILVRSLPMVSMTRRPHSHRPTEMPMPP